MVTTSSSSSTRSSTFMSPGSWVITVRRSLANFSRISPSSVAITPRSLAGSLRIDSSSAISSSSLASSSSRLVRPSRVSRARVMSRMWLACSSENSNGAACRVSEGGRPVVRTPDGGDDRVEHVDGLEQALDHVGPGPGLVQQELGPAGHHLDLVGHVVGQDLGQVERPRHPVDQRHRVDAERGLHRRLLEQVVEDHVGVGVALEADHQPGLAARTSRPGPRRCRRGRRPGPGPRSSSRPRRSTSGRASR